MVGQKSQGPGPGIFGGILKFRENAKTARKKFGGCIGGPSRISRGPGKISRGPARYQDISRHEFYKACRKLQARGPVQCKLMGAWKQIMGPGKIPRRPSMSSRRPKTSFKSDASSRCWCHVSSWGPARSSWGPAKYYDVQA